MKWGIKKVCNLITVPDLMYWPLYWADGGRPLLASIWLFFDFQYTSQYAPAKEQIPKSANPIATNLFLLPTLLSGRLDILRLRPLANSRALQKNATMKLLLFLVVFRVLNGLSLKTFFDPDEYWQSLEVAHATVFGYVLESFPEKTFFSESSFFTC